jgi:ATP-dependent Clp protease ATP-binding subunit ClpA
MFERFTARARQVIVLAQDESRRLQHNFIGTEHILLGLLAEGEGVGGQALAAAGVTLDETRARVEQVIGRGKRTPSGHIPFTPRAKKVLELGLREALNLGHDYIGTEHLLLGIIREGEGLGTKLLVQQHVDLAALRAQVVALVPPAAEKNRRRFWASRHRAFTSPSAPPDDVRTTVAATTSLDEAQRLAGEAAVGSHHLLLATLSDPTSAAAKALGSLGIDLDQARTALRNVDVAGTTDELPEEAGRRQLTMRLTDATLTLETTDPTLIAHARRALVGPDFTLRGEDDRSRGFADVWSAWDASLRATAAAIGELADEEPPG